MKSAQKTAQLYIPVRFAHGFASGAGAADLRQWQQY
jgi:dTDP-4-dehydrorhamnose 3,5-epimerase-like enzyme